MDDETAPRLRPVPDAPTDEDVELAPADRRLAHVGIRLTLAVVAVQTVLHLLNLALSTSIRSLDVNGEQTLFSWLSSVVIATAALACLLLAVVQRGRNVSLLALGGMLAFLSLDEAVLIHERLVIRLTEALEIRAEWNSVIWPVLYLPLLASVLALLVLEARRGARSTSVLVFVGLGCLAAAVGAEIVSAPYSLDDYGIAHSLEGAIEEGLEVAGWGLIATAMLSRFALAIERPLSPT
ncbi:MAG: hypothetical protein ABIR67_05865 [Gaiellaceae bacterium]